MTNAPAPRPACPRPTTRRAPVKSGYAAALASPGATGRPVDPSRAVVWPSASRKPKPKPKPSTPPSSPLTPTRPRPARAKSSPTGAAYRPVLADDSPSIVLIDTVNAFFAWYYSTLRRYNRARHRKPAATVDADDEAGMQSLRAAFETTFRRSIQAILTLTGAARQDVVFATDCQRYKVWRNDLLRDEKTDKPLYKAQRSTRKDAGIPAVMRFLYDDLLPRLMPRRRVGAPRAEADDVIGVIARLVNARAPRRRVFVISDDSDFVQLLDFPSNELYSQRLRSQREKFTRPANDYKQMKILMGDKIDNIDAAFPRCGPNTAEALLDDPALMAAKIQKYGREKLDRNRVLIDFDMIPAAVRSAIVERALLVRHRARACPSADTTPRSPYFQKMAQRGL
jgi:5'-3' exonuclease